MVDGRPPSELIDGPQCVMTCRSPDALRPAATANSNSGHSSCVLDADCTERLLPAWDQPVSLRFLAGGLVRIAVGHRDQTAIRKRPYSCLSDSIRFKAAMLLPRLAARSVALCPLYSL